MFIIKLFTQRRKGITRHVKETQKLQLLTIIIQCLCLVVPSEGGNCTEKRSNPYKQTLSN